MMGSESEPKNLSEAAGKILNKLCYRAADELGTHLAHWTRDWRRGNAASILGRANEKYEKYSETGKEQAPPRLVCKVLDEGTWTDDPLLQEMWAGLLTSSCSPDNQDDSNLIFMNTLSQLTTLQAKILSHIFKNAHVAMSEGGWITAENLFAHLDDLIEITGVKDFHRIDRELDHMRGLELLIIQGGFRPETKVADIIPTSFALQMFARCEGFMGSPLKFYNLEGDE